MAKITLTRYLEHINCYGGYKEKTDELTCKSIEEARKKKNRLEKQETSVNAVWIIR